MIRKREADAIPMTCADGPFGRPVLAAKTVLCSEGYDILNVDISLGGEVVARYFADPVEEEFKGFVIGKPWRKIKLGNLIMEVKGREPIKNATWWGIPEIYEWDDGSERLARECLGESVTFFENHVESRLYYERLDRKYRKMLARINAALRPTPDGFEEWARELATRQIATLVDDGEAGPEYQCTVCCGRWTRKKKYRQNREITCPVCGAKVKATKERDSVKHAFIFSTQAREDGWYERYISIHVSWHDDKWNITLHDMNLVLMKPGEQFGEHYYREGTGYSENSHNGQLSNIHRGYIYPDFGGAEEFMSEQQAHCLRALADMKVNVNANKCIMLGELPALEYLLKGRYTRLAVDIIERQGAGLTKRNANVGHSAQDFLMLDKQRCNRLRQVNGSFLEWAWLRYEKATGRKVSADDLQWFKKNRIDPNETMNGTWEMLSHIPSPTAFHNYLVKQSKICGESAQSVISTYTDYRRMAEALGMNLDSEIFRKPKNLRDAHDECVRAVHEKELDMKEVENERKYPGVTEVLKGIAEKYSYEGEEYMIVVPGRIMDILAEGRALGHCIDTSDRYFDRIRNHVTYIVFLRKKDKPRQSWYTLEIEPGGTVRQQRTTGNRQHKEDVQAYMPFIREWQKVVRQRLSEEDRAAAERSRSIRLEEYRDLRERKETVRSGLLAGQLLVDVLEADLVEAI